MSSMAPEPTGMRVSTLESSPATVISYNAHQLSRASVEASAASPSASPLALLGM